MCAARPFQSTPSPTMPPPFPARGVPGGWHDPWDSDPLEAIVAVLRQQTLRRHVHEAGVPLELVAQARADGRWEAHVTAGDEHATRWPSVNGPTATVALDALEAELREMIRSTGTLEH